MRRIIGALVLFAVVVLPSYFGATAHADPMVFDKKIGYFRDMSYEALSDEGLSWEQKTRIFGGETATYGPLTAAARKAKQKELKDLLAKIDMKLVNKCDADIRAWLDEQAAAPLKRPGWEKNWKQDWSVYTKASIWPLVFGSITFFRAYEIWGDEKYLKAGLRRVEPFLKAQAEIKKGPYRLKGGVCRIQDKWQDGPFYAVLYAHKMTGDKKYFESAKKLADCLLPLQRPSGGWPDQWPMGGRVGGTGIVHGMSHNDSATMSPFTVMVMMYHMTKDKKYIANLHKLGPFIEKTNLGEGKVVGWAEQYADNGRPVRARQYELELPYSKTLPRSVGPLLIWLYLMDGDERHMDLLKRAYAWHEHVRQKELEPWQIEAWKKLSKAAGGQIWRPGWAAAWLPNGSNWGDVIHWGMYAYYPVTDEMVKNSGKYTGGRSLIFSRGNLKTWAEAGAPPYPGAGQNDAGNALCQVRRALLEHKRGGYKGLLRYYTGPTKYTPDQYLQARVDAAKRALDPRNNRLAALHEKGIRSLKEASHVAGSKTRWYGPKHTKWGKAYEDYIMRKGRWPGHAALYQWQLVYDTLLAQGKVDADTAAQGGRGMEAWVGSHNNLDSWDVIGQYDMHAFEVENHFDIPIKGKKK